MPQGAATRCNSSEVIFILALAKLCIREAPFDTHSFLCSSVKKWQLSLEVWEKESLIQMQKQPFSPSCNTQRVILNAAHHSQNKPNFN